MRKLLSPAVAMGTVSTVFFFMLTRPLLHPVCSQVTSRVMSVACPTMKATRAVSALVRFS